MKFSGLVLVGVSLVGLVAPRQSLQAQKNKAALTNAVSQVTCPVSMAAPTRRGNTLHLAFQNTSGKTIRGILFGAAYYDENEAVHVIKVLTDEHRMIPSGVAKTGDLNISYWRRTQYAGWATWPSKILYSDGSSWQIGPNGAACVANYWQAGRHPRTLLAEVPQGDEPVGSAVAAEDAIDTALDR